MWDFVDGGAVIISLRNEAAHRRPEVEKAVVHDLGMRNAKFMLVAKDADGGVAGCMRSHIGAAKAFLAKGVEWGMVFEDDVRMFPKHKALVPRIARLLQEWCAEHDRDAPAFVQLGYATLLGFHRTVGDADKDFPDIVRVNGSVCMQSYLYNRAAMRRIAVLEDEKGVHPIDSNLVRTPHWVLRPMLFYQSDMGSDVNGARNATLALQRTISMRGVAEMSEFAMLDANSCIASIVAITVVLTAALGVSIWGSVEPMKHNRRGQVGLSVLTALVGAAWVLSIVCVSAIANLCKVEYTQPPMWS